LGDLRERPEEALPSLDDMLQGYFVSSNDVIYATEVVTIQINAGFYPGSFLLEFEIQILRFS